MSCMRMNSLLDAYYYYFFFFLQLFLNLFMCENVHYHRNFMHTAMQQQIARTSMHGIQSKTNVSDNACHRNYNTHMLSANSFLEIKSKKISRENYRKKQSQQQKQISPNALCGFLITWLLG